MSRQIVAAATALGAALTAGASWAQVSVDCRDTPLVAGWTEFVSDYPRVKGCSNTDPGPGTPNPLPPNPTTPNGRCYPPTLQGGVTYTVSPVGCDPRIANCGVRAKARLRFVGNESTVADNGNITNSATPQFVWFSQATAPNCTFVNCLSQPSLYASCGNPTGGVQIPVDEIDARIDVAGINCGNAGSQAQYSLRAFVCPAGGACEKPISVNAFFEPFLFPLQIGCPIPPKDDCNENPKKCVDCKGLAAGGGGAPPPCSMTPGTKGMSCTERVAATVGYRAGGVGGTGFPGTGGANDWRIRLGQNWSHTFAKRIVMDPDNSHVWLLTDGGSFREFKNLASGGSLRRYQVNSPTDEFRVLFFDTATSGWQLKELDGVIHVFTASGFWDRTILPSDPLHPIRADYAGGALDLVTFPDGRREKFTYHPSGRLAQLEKLPRSGL